MHSTAKELSNLKLAHYVDFDLHVMNVHIFCIIEVYVITRAVTQGDS